MRALCVVLLLASISVGVVRPAAAAAIAGLHYVAGNDLVRIDFDGNGFPSGGGVVVYSGLNPAWSAMSWDQPTETMYYVAGTDLVRIKFDGSGFPEGGGVVLFSGLNPVWSAMSWNPATQDLYYVAGTDLVRIKFDGNGFPEGGGVVLFSGLNPVWTAMTWDPTTQNMYYVAGTDFVRIKFDGSGFPEGGGVVLFSGLNPTWSAMSLIYAADDGGTPSVPAPAALPLFVSALLLLGWHRGASRPRPAQRAARGAAVAGHHAPA